MNGQGDPPLGSIKDQYSSEDDQPDDSSEPVNQRQLDDVYSSIQAARQEAKDDIQSSVSDQLLRDLAGSRHFTVMVLMLLSAFLAVIIGLTTFVGILVFGHDHR